MLPTKVNTKQDYRLHEGEKIVFDIKKEIIEIVDKLKDNQFYDFLPIEGWYLPGLNVPVIENRLQYFYFNKEGEKCLFTEPKTVVGDIYRAVDGKVVVPARNVKRLQNYPTDNLQINEVIIAVVESFLEKYRKYDKSTHRADLETTIVDRLSVVSKYTYEDDTYSIPDDLITGIESVQAILDEDLIPLIVDISQSNPWMIFNVSINNGVLIIEALVDYRVHEWTQEKHRKEIEQDLES